MAGHMGHEQVTTQNLEVVAVRPRAQPAADQGLGSRPRRWRRHRPQRRQVRRKGRLTWQRSPSRTQPARTPARSTSTTTSSASQPNVPLMHQVVTAQLAARRSGTQSTKTRSDVSGGGRKPLRPEGHRQRPPGLDPCTALHRWWRRPRPEAPQVRPEDPQEDDQGGAALGAVRPCQRGQGHRRRLLRHRRHRRPRTPRRCSTALGIAGTVLVVVGRDDAAAALSFRNLPHVQVIGPGELNAYDVLCNDWIVFTKDVVPRRHRGRRQGEPAVEPPSRASRRRCSRAAATATASQAVEPRRRRRLARPSRRRDAEGSRSRATPTRCSTTFPTLVLQRTVAEVWFATEDAARPPASRSQASRAAERRGGA